MAYDGKLLAKARNQLDNIRAANQAEQQRRRGLVYARLPELERLLPKDAAAAVYQHFREKEAAEK